MSFQTPGQRKIAARAGARSPDIECRGLWCADAAKPLGRIARQAPKAPGLRFEQSASLDCARWPTEFTGPVYCGYCCITQC